MEPPGRKTCKTSPSANVWSVPVELANSHCERALVNRLFDYCLYCCVMLPEELLLTDEQKGIIMQRDRDQMTEDRRLRIAEAEESKERARKLANGMGPMLNVMLFLP